MICYIMNSVFSDVYLIQKNGQHLSVQKGNHGSSNNGLFRSLPSRSTTPTLSTKAEKSFSTVPLVRKPPVRPMSPPSTTPRKPAAASGSTLDVPPVMPRRPKRAQHASSAKPDPKLMRRSLSLNQVDVVQIPGSVTVKADTTEHLVDACQQYLDRMAEEPRSSPPKGMEAADEIVVDGVDVVTVGERANSGYGTHPRAMKKNIHK